jgi:hypothetical protein
MAEGRSLEGYATREPVGKPLKILGFLAGLDGANGRRRPELRSGSLPHRSRMAWEATSTSGENRYSSMRRVPVLSSTVAAMPEVSG